MNFLGKIRNLPELKRKIILWLVVIIIGLIFFIFWVQNAQEKFKSFQAEKFLKELKIPSFGKELKNLPKINESR